MIPLRDDVPAARPPVVTRALVVACAAVFLLQVGDPDGELVRAYGMVPGRVLDPASPAWDLPHRLAGGRETPPVGAAAVPDWLTLLTCTFLHGSFLHFAGNMLFLWIFGDNVEDRFGRLRFLAFYLACGIAASAAHLLAAPGSPAPTIGASGAVAGVMGAYMLLYPHARVQMLVIWGPFLDFLVLPAPFFLGYWFLLQLVGSLADAGVGGGVAWWAHVGGFLVGAGVAWALRAVGALLPAPARVTLARGRVAPRRR